MCRFLYENHRGSPILTLLNVLGVMGVLNVLNMLNVPNMPIDASSPCWALFLLPLAFATNNFHFGHAAISSSYCRIGSF